MSHSVLKASTSVLKKILAVLTLFVNYVNCEFC